MTFYYARRNWETPPVTGSVLKLSLNYLLFYKGFAFAYLVIMLGTLRMATRFHSAAFCKNVALVEIFRSSLPKVRIETIFLLGKMDVSVDERHSQKTALSRAMTNPLLRHGIPFAKDCGLNDSPKPFCRH